MGKPSYYETERQLNEYLLFHYGEESDILPYNFGPKNALGFPVRCVDECLDPKIIKSGGTRAMDLGCAVGRATFELTKYCDYALGVDISRSFIDAANEIKTKGELEFSILEEGNISRNAKVELSPEFDRLKAEFIVGDAMDLPTDIGKFDVVLMANLIDRLPNPKILLQRLKDLVVPGGQVIIASPYTWLGEFSPEVNWLGGFENEGEPVKSIQTLHKLLDPDFECVMEKDLPFFIREHARKFQWSVAQATRWIRK